MMSTPQMPQNTPVNAFMVSPNGPPPPNSIPYQVHIGMNPGPHQVNQHLPTPPWNAAQVGLPNFPTTTTTQQWSTQPGMTVQTNANYIIPQPICPTSWLPTFEKAKPKALGIVLIIAAICQIPIAIGFPFITYSISFYSGIHFWAPVFYISAGSLSIRAQKRQNISQVKATLGLNIVSSIFSFTGIIINGVDFGVIHSYCDPYYYECYDYYYPTAGAAYALLAILLILNVLVFCVTVSLAVFSGRALDKVPSNVPSMLVIQNVVPVSPSAYPPNIPDFPVSPPPYGQKGN
ncbi:membrane-spanning 4-domains subfamily A member 4A-like [Anomaloglossus baeobatrachus]|uniref:membrane-spanning 4-domains subfamily A member 4A-like n=1 Tax=Anomaloglossus baeobatrachus TaxID=238106 RepID=UPI003F4FBD34